MQGIMMAMLFLIQESPAYSPDVVILPPGYWVMPWLGSLLGLLYTAFMLWMLFECIQRDPDRYFWFWIILIIQGIGPFVYFFARYLPNRSYHQPVVLNFLSNRKEVQRLEMATIQIGNAYHHVQYGEKLMSLKRWPQAKESFEAALRKDPFSIQAMWGMACSQMALKNYQEAQPLLESILEKDPGYKFGDVSMAYGKTLQELGEVQKARDHFSEHLKRWRQPEACYRLAQLLFEDNQTPQAKDVLQNLLVDFRASPSSFNSRHRQWKRKAKSLLSQIK